MMQYSSNINIVIGGLKDKLTGLVDNPDPLLRTIALTVLPEIKKRVHVDGRASDGSPIGTYSPGYLKLRTGQVGTKKYNRTGDSKVILSLTRQMENDLSVLPVGKGYGIGYNNSDNYQKSQWNEQTYKKSIWNLSEEERDLVIDTAQNFVSDYIKQ